VGNVLDADDKTVPAGAMEPTRISIEDIPRCTQPRGKWGIPVLAFPEIDL
jgi:hypothetical protein